MRTALFLGLALVATGAVAQGVHDLPDRPIARGEVVEVVRRQFAAMDANHDGRISEREFEAYRARQANAPATGGLAAFDHIGRHWFERADADGDGFVSRDEAMTRPLHLFDLADANGDGIVSPSEKRVASLLMGLGSN